MYTPLFDIYTDVVAAFEGIHAIEMKPFVAEFTDAGPGVRATNYEVCFRMVEISRIHNTQRRTRVRRSRGDSA